MKIEKINDNQIRCTLTRDDLAQRQLKLSELAYGSEKAKSLFREMMQQAASEFGFESDNLPLMPILRSRNRLLLQKPKKQLLLNLLFHRSGFSLSQDLTV